MLRFSCHLFLSRRVTVCQQVLKGIVDKIEREEKTTGRRQRAKESAEERKARACQAKLQGVLVRHTDFLRREIMRKRALMEKELQIQIQVGGVRRYGGRLPFCFGSLSSGFTFHESLGSRVLGPSQYPACLLRYHFYDKLPGLRRFVKHATG